MLAGEEPEPFRVTSGGLSFLVDLMAGQKTGLYLDQLGNYGAIADMAEGKRVLDCFTNQGGFALAAARGGAESVTAVDSSGPALANAAANAEAIGQADKIEWVEANVFDYLKEAESNEERYDLIILDPPSFTRSKRSVKDAMRGYKEIHLRALKMLEPGRKTGNLHLLPPRRACGVFRHAVPGLGRREALDPAGGSADPARGPPDCDHDSGDGVFEGCGG